MASIAHPPVTARLARDGTLLHADAPLMRLHLEAGGREGGELALPPLLALARHSQRLAMRLSRGISVADSRNRINLWCELEPHGDGVDIRVRDWRETALDMPDTDQDDGGNAAVRLSGEGYVRLDADQRILRLELPAEIDRHFPESDYLYRPWHEFFAAADGNSSPAAPLKAREGETASWLLYQLHRVRFPGDDRLWAVDVFPDIGADRQVVGHDMVLRAEPIGAAARAGRVTDAVLDRRHLARLFGDQIGPALRQPIGRIIANAESIGGRLEGPLRSDYANYATDIAEAARHLLTLVEDLTDLEAIESEGFSAAREDIDLADLGRRAAGLLAVRAGDHGIRIDRPAEDEILPALGEFRRVLQILLNLIGNAINYAPQGSMIWIRLDEQDGKASITVADQGPGMSTEQQSRLFRKWERLGRSGDGGSGLGLYISKRLAEAMGGELVVESAPGQGARFTLILPAG